MARLKVIAEDWGIQTALRHHIGVVDVVSLLGLGVVKIAIIGQLSAFDKLRDIAWEGVFANDDLIVAIDPSALPFVLGEILMHDLEIFLHDVNGDFAADLTSVGVAAKDFVLANEDDIGIVLAFEDAGIDDVIDSRVFKGEDYSYVILVGKNEVLCRDTHAREVGSKVSIHVVKENLQIMHKDLTENEWESAWINSDNQVVIGEDPFPCDITKLIKGTQLTDDGNLYDPKTKKTYDVNDADVVAECGLDAPVLSDNLETGHSQGRIISSVWLGDHYQYLVRTDDEEDFVCNTPYQWNEGDTVAVDIPAESIRLRLKKDPENYVIDK